MKSILLVEDDPWSSEAIALLLESEGYRTRTVKNGREALNALKESQYDAVLLDLWLASSSGAEVGRAIHEMRELPIIIMSAASEAELQYAAQRVKAISVLRKPFDAATLRSTLADAMSLLHRDELPVTRRPPPGPKGAEAR